MPASPFITTLPFCSFEPIAILHVNMLAFTPHFAMLATFFSLLAITILPASTIAAAVVESEGSNPFTFKKIPIVGKLFGRGERQLFEKDDKLNEELGVPGTIQLKVSHRHVFDDLILGLTGHFRA